MKVQFMFHNFRSTKMEWTDNHRHFMQYILSHRILEKTQLEKIHETIFGEGTNLQRTLDQIDTKIPKLGR